MGFYRRFFRRLFPRKTKTDFPGGYIPHKFFRERVARGPVLIVGDYDDRDYTAFKRAINETYLLDVVDNGIAPEKYFIPQSLADPLPFPDGFFEYVIIAEVIEHVWEDKKVLGEVRRVLCPGGALILTIPFFHDFIPYHYHIYSPRTIRILLEHSGYEVDEMQYRGFVMSIPNFIIGMLAILAFPFYGRNALQKVNNFFYKIHISLSRWERFNKLFKTFGALIVAEASGRGIDPLEIQRQTFGRKRT